ncbi:14657_t:CDS:2, partial [Dentiscutata heterogama]
SESLISDRIETGSTTDNILDFDLEINNFCFDEDSFERAQILAEAEETNDLILLNNMDNDDIDIYGNDILTLSEFDSVSSMSGSNENEYLIEDLILKKSNKILTPCPIIDINDGRIQCCLAYSPKQRCLAQLVGSWEIDEMIFHLAQRNVNLVKIIEPKCTINDKTATDLGRALGAATW